MQATLSSTSRRVAAPADMLDRQLRRFHPRFQGAVRLMAMRHPRVADLAASFPGLLFALAVPRRGLDLAPALERVIAGRGLADVARAADVPLWLRKLPPEAFAQPVAKLPDGALFRRQIANHVPRSPKLASAWLRAVAELGDYAHDSAAVWIARELVRQPRVVKLERLRLIGLWSWYSGEPSSFGGELIEQRWTPDISFGAAITAAEAWRTLVTLHLDLGPRPIDDVWLEPARVAGYDFLPLRSIADIVEEAAAMRNCLRTYGANVAHNQARLWSVRRDGERVATLRLACRYREPLPNIVELKGPGNAEVSRELWWVARQWLHSHDLLRLDTRQRAWGTVGLDRATWLSMWRPYWLGKRRIPDWLPIAPSRGRLEAL